MGEADRLNPSSVDCKYKRHGPRNSDKIWIVATDSKYVVKGMTEWLPAWRVFSPASRTTRFILRRGGGRKTIFAPAATRGLGIWTFSLTWMLQLQRKKLDRMLRLAFGIPLELRMGLLIGLPKKLRS